MSKMKSGTGIKITHRTTTITSSYVVTNKVEDFNFTTTVTNDHETVMSQWSFRMKNYPSTREVVIGLEAQFRPYSWKPVIVTLCGFDACLSLIIQLPSIRKPISDQLLNLFSDKRCKFVGTNVGHSVAMLKEHYGINIDKYEDISDIARGRSFEEFLKPTSARMLSKLMMDLMILRKKPEIDCAVWEKEKLDEDPVAYAALESYLSYMIGTSGK